jgi:alkylation response protein AidB-like acyl-CoA dehydrogenase
MPAYRADLIDIEFNLFDLLKIHEKNNLGMDISSLKDILLQFEKFTRQEIYPTRTKSDHEGVKLENGRVISPESLRAVHKAYYENGWFVLGQPEEFGGAPVPESLYYACLSIATGANTAYMMYPGLSKGALNVIRLKGQEWMRKVFLPPMMDGRLGGTMCLTEPGAGSDVGALRTTATPTSNNDGTWLIKGTKIFISSGHADLYENTVHLVLARTPNAPEGTKGISLFIVPRIWIDKEGKTHQDNDVLCTKVEEKMGIHASATCELQFGLKNQCRGYLIGDEFEGMSTMFIMMNEARLLCGLQGESQANLAYEMSLAYAKERSQFNKEIVYHPDVKRMLLKMRANVRAMRQVALFTASLFDKEKEDAKYGELIGLLTPICKAYFTEQGLEVAVDAVQIHGGYGFCKEYEVEQFVRDTIIGKIYEGTNGIQAIDFTMRKVIKDKAKSFSWLAEIMTADMKSLDQKFSAEVNMWNQCLNVTNQITQLFFEKAANKDMDFVLYHATDYLKICSILIHGWQLGVAASGAKNKLLKGENLNQEWKNYLQTREVDFQVYSTFYLATATSIADSIKKTKLDFWKSLL